jgi:hypothetical protein
MTVLLPDVNVSSKHLALSTAVLASLVRIATHPRIMGTPSSPREALNFTQSLLDDPQTWVVVPSSRHWPLFHEFVSELRLAGNDIPDAFSRGPRGRP